jgi:Arc/MetJ-type ribon-helix-helix transcriptional regulator
MKDENITIRVDKAILDRLDEWRKAQEFNISRASVIRAALERFLVQEARQ